MVANFDGRTTSSAVDICGETLTRHVSPKEKVTRGNHSRIIV